MQDLLLKYARSFGDTTKKKFVSLIQDVEKLSKIINFTQKEEIKKFIDHPNIQNSISIFNRDLIDESIQNLGVVEERLT